jgi:hypothetical protein
MTKRLTTREDILEAFAIEPSADRQTLERYIREYPEQAAALVDLAQQIDFIANSESTELRVEDEALIDAAWKKHAAVMRSAPVDPLKNLAVEKQREVAHSLSVPRQVITAFRDGKIILSSVPQKFLRSFAEALSTTFDDLVASLSAPRLAAAKSFKADDKPQESDQVTFEQVLIEAGVDPDARARLLADVN